MIPAEIARVAQLGWQIYPASKTSKAGCFPGATDAATADLDQIDRWSRTYPGCNWRVVCGPSKLFALDVDRPGTHKADGFATMQRLVAKHGPLPPRPMTRTGGSGGAVLFFRYAGEPLRGASGAIGPGLDPHRGRQAIVLPPSRHPITGGSYAWRVAPWDSDLPAIPAWLAQALAPPPLPAPPSYDWRPTDAAARAAMTRAALVVATAPAGQTNDILNRKAYYLGRWCAVGKLHTDEVTRYLYDAARARGVPHIEAQATIKSGLRSGLCRPLDGRT